MKKTITLSIMFILLISSAYAASVTLTPTNAGDEYIYEYNYGSTGTVDYQTNSDNFRANVQATGLKPGFTYQVKLMGTPSCAGGDDYTNELIGYSGRWYCSACSGSEVSKNRNDAQYVANKAKLDSDPTKECIHGYLIFDYVTADSNGNINVDVISDGSYHVLWCGGSNGNLYYVNKENYPFNAYTLKCTAPRLCNSGNVIPEVERSSFNKLPSGDYSNVKLALTEESFHENCGTWTNVLESSVNFSVGGEQVPEFDFIAAGLALVGAGAGFLILRKRR